MRHREIIERPGYVKDMDSGAIINTDNPGLEAYRARKKIMAAQSERINKIEEDVQDIKELLQEILGKLK